LERAREGGLHLRHHSTSERGTAKEDGGPGGVTVDRVDKGPVKQLGQKEEGAHNAAVPIP